MSRKKYVPLNEVQINTSDSDQENPIPNQTTEHRYRQASPSEEPEHKRNQDIAVPYSTIQSTIYSSQNQQEMKSNVAELDATRSSEIASNYSNSFHGPTIDNYQEDTPLFSCPSKPNPKAIYEAKVQAGINSSTYISDSDLADAGPSCVTCDICNQTFDDEYLLENHKSIHTSEKPLSDCSFSKTKLPKNPLLPYMKKKKHQCDQCLESFSLKRSLVAHKIIHTGEKPYECEKCHENFTQNRHLLNHLKIHTSEKPHKCDKCGKSFSYLGKLRRHYQCCGSVLADRYRQHQCDICHKSYTSKEHLRRHYRTHTGEKSYECEMCHEKFSRKSTLRRHYLTHTGEKPFECEKCHNKFSTKRDLRHHYRTHTGEKPYECEMCHEKFSIKSTLRRHYLTHTGEKRYECEMCHNKFSTKTDLGRHYLTHTGEKPFECEKCHKKFARKDGLNSHRRTHTDCQRFKCRKCGKSFADEGKLSGHSKKCVFSPKKE